MSRHFHLVVIIYYLVVLTAPFLQVRECGLSYSHVKQRIWIPELRFPRCNSCQHYVLLGIAGSAATGALWLWSCACQCSSSSLTHRLWSESATCCLYSARSFFLLSFLLLWNCNPSGHPMKHKLNSSTGELSLDFTVPTGQPHFWSWVKTHMPHWLISILVWDSFGLRSCVFQQGKKTLTSSTFSLQDRSWECGTPCKVAF